MCSSEKDEYKYLLAKQKFQIFRIFLSFLELGTKLEEVKMQFKKWKIFLVLYSMLIANIVYSAEIDTLTITPFKVIGDSENSDIFSHGLPEAIAHDLSSIQNLTIIERLRLSTVLQELSLAQTGLITEKNAPRVGEMLGAKILIVGTVQKLGNNVRVIARAVNTTSGNIIFSVNVDKKIVAFKDVFKLEDTLAQKIVLRLGLTLTKKNLTEFEIPVTSSEDAFRHYSRGLKYLDLGNLEKSFKNLKKATEIDEQFNLAQKLRIRAQQAFEELDKEVK